MGVPVPEMTPETNPVDEASAETLLSSLRTIAAAERRKHASVYNYWLSIRGNREFPPIHDLDPLEISDSGAFSILLEMIGGGEDAEIRHLGRAISNGLKVENVSEAPNPSLLSCIATRLPVVAACRDAFAFEDEFETSEGKTRCWVSLLPFSATGTWIDFVYGFVSLDPGPVAAQSQDAKASVIEDALEPPAQEHEEPEETLEPPLQEIPSCLETAEPEAKEKQEFGDRSSIEDEPALLGDIAEPDSEPNPLEHANEPGVEPIPIEDIAEPFDDLQPIPFEEIAGIAAVEEEVDKHVDAPDQESIEEFEDFSSQELAEDLTDPAPLPTIKPGFSKKFLDTLASVKGFYGNPVEVELDPETVAFECGDAAATETTPSDQPSPTLEGNLEIKLTDVRAKADEARQAKLRANAALYEGLSAAYDFALDAEDSPEEYLRLVQAEGLKIQLRSPMKPVAKLAFDGMCDEATIKQLEAVLAWAFEQELPRGALADRIESEGGIGSILSRDLKAA